MKRIINILIFLFIAGNNIVLAGQFTFCKKSSDVRSIRISTPTDTTLAYLMTVSLENYKNRPVDTFLVKLPVNFISQKVYGSGRPKYADVLIVTYPNGIVVHIFVRRFTHMNPKSNVLQWNINLFKLEDVDHIEIHNGVNCVKGCL